MNLTQLEQAKRYITLSNVGSDGKLYSNRYPEQLFGPNLDEDDVVRILEEFVKKQLTAYGELMTKVDVEYLPSHYKDVEFFRTFARDHLYLAEGLNVVFKEPNMLFADDESEWIKNAYAVIIGKRLTGGQKETLQKIGMSQGLEDGDMPSKADRGSLVDLGLVERVTIKGHYGPWVVNHKGWLVGKYLGMFK